MLHFSLFSQYIYRSQINREKWTKFPFILYKILYVFIPIYLFVCLFFFSFVQYFCLLCGLCVFVVFHQLALLLPLTGYQSGLEVYVKLCNAHFDMDSGNFGDNRANCYTNCTYAGSVVLLAKLCSICWPPFLFVLMLGHGKKNEEVGVFT